jgi:hypothetical protein
VRSSSNSRSLAELRSSDRIQYDTLSKPIQARIEGAYAKGLSFKGSTRAELLQWTLGLARSTYERSNGGSIGLSVRETDLDAMIKPRRLGFGSVLAALLQRNKRDSSIEKLVDAVARLDTLASSTPTESSLHEREREIRALEAELVDLLPRPGRATGEIETILRGLIQKVVHDVEELLDGLDSSSLGAVQAILHACGRIYDSVAVPTSDAELRARLPKPSLSRPPTTPYDPVSRLLELEDDLRDQLKKRFGELIRASKTGEITAGELCRQAFNAYRVAHNASLAASIHGPPAPTPARSFIDDPRAEILYAAALAGAHAQSRSNEPYGADWRLPQHFMTILLHWMGWSTLSSRRTPLDSVRGMIELANPIVLEREVHRRWAEKKGEPFGPSLSSAEVPRLSEQPVFDEHTIVRVPTVDSEPESPPRAATRRRDLRRPESRRVDAKKSEALGHLRPASTKDYASWLIAFLEKGGAVTHFYDYPMARADFWVATEDFPLGPFFGADSISVIVPDGKRYMDDGTGLGHCDLFFEHQHRHTGSVPAYSDTVELARARSDVAAEVLEKGQSSSRSRDLQHALERARVDVSQIFDQVSMLAGKPITDPIRSRAEVRGSMRPAAPMDYARWLAGHVEAGGRVTHSYDYPMPRDRFHIARDDFILGPFYGSESLNVIVRSGARFLGGQTGHCNLYFLDGSQSPVFVPVYPDVIAALRQISPSAAQSVTRQIAGMRTHDLR